MKQLIILTVFMLFQVSVFGQSINNSCGTQVSQSDYNDIKATLLARGSLGNTNFSRTLNTIRIRLKPHIVRRSNGTGGLSLTDLQTSIQQLNNNFLQAGIRFEMCSVNYIDDDLFFDAVTPNRNQFTGGCVESVPTADCNLARPNIEINAANVFFVPNGVANVNSPYPFNWSNFPISLAQNINWTIMSNVYATDGGTLAHEIGHYFNLLHTHDTSYGRENVIRYIIRDCPKNCETTGDLLCDTPADPDLGGVTLLGDPWPPTAKHVDANCNYKPKSKFRDDCNAEYVPDTHNIMSYAYHCRTHFSYGQIARMREVITLDRPEVVVGPSSNLTITSVITNGKQAFNALNSITAFNTIEASGKGIYTAGYEITLSPNFTSKIGSEFDAFISNCDVTYTLPPIKDDVKKNEKLASLQELDVSIYPIPIKDKATIKFNLQNDVDNVDIGLYDLAGFMIKKLAKDSSYKKGEHTITLDASGLTPKVYIIIFNTSEGERITKKIIVR